MTAVKRWVAAGSSAAILTGGLLLGAPAAYADTCAAPAAGGAVSDLITAAGDLHDTGVHFNSLVADEGVLARIQTQQAVLEDAVVNDDTMDRARGAWTEILRLQGSYAAATDSPAVDDAYAASSAAAANFETVATDARRQNLVFMEDGAGLLALFKTGCSPADAGLTDWSGTGTAPGANTGLNVDTAQEGQGVPAPLVALLAAGTAAAGAVTLRVRRHGRV